MWPDQVYRYNGSDVSQRSYNPDFPLVFIHINKAAGTAFSNYLFSLFDKDEVAKPYRGIMEATDPKNPTKMLYHGHMRFADWYTRGRQGYLLTFLRSPEERILSQYKSFKSKRNEKDAKNWAADSEKTLNTLKFTQDATFEEFLSSDDPMIRGHINNLQTQFLSLSGRCNDGDELTAVENLNKRFLFFGITDYFEESIELFRWQFGVEKPFDVAKERRNVSESFDIEMTPLCRELLRNNSRLDWHVYEQAVTIFKSRVAKMREVKVDAVG